MNEVADWFLDRADPEHKAIEMSGVRWEYCNGKWNFKVVDAEWNRYWENAIERNKERGWVWSCQVRGREH